MKEENCEKETLYATNLSDKHSANSSHACCLLVKRSCNTRRGFVDILPRYRSKICSCLRRGGGTSRQKCCSTAITSSSQSPVNSISTHPTQMQQHRSHDFFLTKSSNQMSPISWLFPCAMLRFRLHNIRPFHISTSTSNFFDSERNVLQMSSHSQQMFILPRLISFWRLVLMCPCPIRILHYHC